MGGGQVDKPCLHCLKPGIKIFMFRSFVLTAAQEGRRQARRHFTSSAAAAGAVVARRAALLFPSAGLGYYAVSGDEPRRFAYTASVLPLRLARDAKMAILTVLGR